MALIDSLVIVILLAIWMVTWKPGTTERTISYTRASNHILVELAKLPEFTKAEMHDVPLWTLHGDGTLIFRTDPSDTMWQTRLSPNEVQHILDVIINQDTFLANKAQRYGSIASAQDDDQLLLTVNANGQQKKVILMSIPTNKVAIDIQTTHVFAIEQFLLSYHPVNSVLYAPNANPDHDSDDGQ